MLNPIISTQVSMWECTALKGNECVMLRAQGLVLPGGRRQILLHRDLPQQLLEREMKLGS